jgi:hypothetical protein
MTHEAGKGSRPRPFAVTQEEYATRWDVIFSRDKISKEIQAEKQQQEKAQEKNNTEQVN